MDNAQHEAIENAVAGLPAELQTSTARWFERLEAEQPVSELRTETIAPLARLIACSDFAAGTVLREWQWFVQVQSALDEPPRHDALRQFVAQITSSTADVAVVQAELRRYRHRFLLQVLWRELQGLATLDETLVALSALADRLLDTAAGYGVRELQERYGVIRDEHGAAVPLVVLGMGKLGGRELNFSSDIDLIFLYPGGKDSDGARTLSAQEYFTRLSRRIVALLDEVTADGFAFRIDTRLRPFGDSGPPVTSFAALEAYLLRHGRGWERYAYVKARIVGPAPPADVADELCKGLIAPFVYRRYLDYGVFESLRKMQGLIAAEVQRRDMADNIKLGPGGIREIEFIVQSLQLVRGGSHPELQECRLLTVLPRLIGDRGISDTDAQELRAAYAFLRRLENFIQALRDQQAHDLPSDAADRARLSFAMGYATWEALRADLKRHRGNVTRQFEAIAFRTVSESADDTQQHVTALWDRAADAAEWREALGNAGYADAEQLAAQLAAFAAAPATLQLGKSARRRLQHFVPQLLPLIRECKQPAIALTRVLAVLEKVLRRSAYIALLNENRQVLARFVDLCERSAYVAGQIERYPVLLDELLDPRIFSAQVSRDDLEAELQQRLALSDADDSEAQMTLLGQFQRVNMFRVAVADFTGHLPIMKVSDALTELAETVLRHALRVAWRDMTGKHGVPQYVMDGKRHDAGFAVIAYGKLGGLELSYGSDLDLVYLHDSRGSAQQTNGDKVLDNPVFFTRLVRRLTHFLTTQTGSGMLYEIDTRLRPDGQKGVLVSSIDAFERYQEANAWTWEHQALLRARPVAGSPRIADEFARIRNDTLATRVRRDKLRDDVLEMRNRMRKELDKSDRQAFDLKHGVGGIGDIEFIVQYLVLKHAGDHPAVFYYSDNIRQLEALAATGSVSNATATQLQDVYRAYRLRLHHLVLDERRPLVSPDDFEPERAVVADIWQRCFAGDSA